MAIAINATAAADNSTAEIVQIPESLCSNGVFGMLVL